MIGKDKERGACLSMKKHFLKYWLYSAVERQMASPHRLINYTASDQYHRVEVGDHLWFVTMPPRTQMLLLFGGMTIGWIGSRAEAAQQLESRPEALRSANIHALSDPETAEPYEVIDITEIAMDLRFDSALGKDRLPARSWPQALQTMRLLTSETAMLMREVWYSSGTTLSASLDPFVPEFLIENRQKIELHHQREHNPVLIAAARDQFERMHGDLFCEACGFDFSQTYGSLGEDFMEIHHRQPFAEIEDDETDVSLDDLALVCANCHRMLHRHKPWLTIEQLRLRLQKRGDQPEK
jgi:hypothetical protein